MEKINIKNYLGNYQNIHPKVLYFKNGWNGFKFWMGYTPYPFGNIIQENPCIAVSNDGVNREVPSGLVDPLDNYPGVGVGTNSDTHLVYRSDNHFSTPGNEDYILSSTTKRGATLTCGDITPNNSRRFNVY